MAVTGVIMILTLTSATYLGMVASLTMLVSEFARNCMYADHLQARSAGGSRVLKQGMNPSGSWQPRRLRDPI